MVMAVTNAVDVAAENARLKAELASARAELTGAKLIELADPQPRATHVSLSGSRGGAPYNLYLPMNDFKALRLENGDQIRFLADRPGDTIMVEAQGAIRGASRFPVRRNTRLHEVMSYIAVEPGRANLEGLYIKRKSVAVRQKKAIEDALRRLEQNAYTATSASSDEAQIRSKEAEMLSNFISRAKEVQPEGVVVVGTKGNIDRQGEVLFIDAREMGHMVDRVERTFSQDDIDTIANTYRTWRGRDSAEGEYEDVPGFSKSATLQEIEDAGWALTPGRYVGMPEAPEDDEPIDDKIARLTDALTEALNESSRLDTVVREQMGRLA